MAGVGSALPDALQYFRLMKLKEMGCNAIRTSHNAATPELLEAADKLGILVMEEQRESGQTPEILDQTRRMILRDRNHPSIILWSIGNEEMAIQGDDDVGVTVARVMCKAIKELDDTRPITAAMNAGCGRGFSRVIDIQGFNYALNTDVTRYHQKHPRQPLIATEEGSTVSTRGIYENDESRGYLSAYDINAPAWACTAQRWWNYYQTRPFMSGAFVWTGFDYRGEPTPFHWPCISSQFGILDTCGFPKDNFYYYQSIWTDKPMLHLLPHWNWLGKQGQPIDVWAYSNCDQVELLVNGQSQGRQNFPAGKHLEWKIPYASGTLLAHGFKAGQEVVTEKVETTGSPAKLVITPDRSTINADGEDVAVIAVAVTDDQGRTVPTASNMVKFTVEGSDGQIIGVGNGDPSCHEPDKAQQRTAFNGLCMAIVQSSTTPGDIKITAASDGLKSATITVTATPATVRKGN
jgi:beta-galactosidase